MLYISNKIGILKDASMGNLMKLKVLYDIRIRKAIKLSSKQETSVILSLTSYGKRVKGSVVYTIYSLLRQNVRAERIVLWLNEEEYNTHNLPNDFVLLCKYGLEIRFAKDLRSYTKIIHSLKHFTDKHIITADDDLYYSKTFVQEFIETHRKHPKAIISGYARMPIFDNTNKQLPYCKWPEYHHIQTDFKYDTYKLCPLGYGGVFYPCNTFDIEAQNELVFTSLCPKADDIWLYVMGLRCKVEKRLLTESHISYYHTDIIRQYFTNDRLTVKNRFEGENDIQLQALLKHYEISI